MKELNKMSVRISKANPWKFFALAIGISWFFWMWVISLGWNVFTFPAIVLGALGLFGVLSPYMCKFRNLQWAYPPKSHFVT